MHQKINRRQALAQGLEYYYTGRPCAAGHRARRATDTGTCMDCAAGMPKITGVPSLTRPVAESKPALVRRATKRNPKAATPPPPAPAVDPADVYPDPAVTVEGEDFETVTEEVVETVVVWLPTYVRPDNLMRYLQRKLAGEVLSVRGENGEVVYNGPSRRG